MRELQGRTALVTGASGGLGGQISRRLAREGVNVVLSGRREQALDALAGELRELGVHAAVVAADVSDLGQIDSLAVRSEAALGPIDLLINNAGVENAGAFTSYTREEIVENININLTAPLLLTHRIVPGMLARGGGHVVFMSSVAGMLGPAYQEPYAASKGALVSLTQSLRVEYMDSPVGFSVICPSFVKGDEGMYQRMLDEGFRARSHTTATKVVDAVIDAIRRDAPLVIEAGMPLRPVLALNELAPRVVERLTRRFGVTDLFQRMALARGRGPDG
jgi:short-subunit dehydrogenase